MPPSSQIGFVLAIEGYEYLLCDTLDTAAVVSAWAGTGWTQALPGLKVRGTMRQSIIPWQQSIDVPTLTFEVQSDPTDRFARDVWRTRPTFQTRLREPFRPAPDGTGFMEVDSTTDIDDVFIGGQRFGVVQDTSTRFAVIDAGRLRAFDADVGNRYSRSVEMPRFQAFNAAARPVVSSEATSWTGRHVALYRHTIKGGRWNARSAAALEFAGRIESIKDDPIRGATIIGCEDLRVMIRDAVLLKEQWVGHVRQGVRLQTGDEFNLHEDITLGNAPSGTPLVVVASGASGNFQVNAGYYELGDFLAVLNNWMGAQTALNLSWSIELQTGEAGSAVAVTCDFPDGVPIPATWQRFSCTDREIFDFLGFRLGAGYDRVRSDMGTFAILMKPAYAAQVGGTISMVAPGPPFVVKPFQARATRSQRGLRVDLDAQDGEWVHHSEYLPSPFDSYVEGEESWSLLRMGDQMYFGRYNGTFLDEVQPALDFGQLASRNSPDDYRLGRTVDDADARFEVYQVVALVGTFADLITKLLVSTDGRGVNHPDFDVLPKGIGGIGMPWGLLGQAWINSVRALDQSMESESLMIVLDKPRKFIDVLLNELILRFAWIVFRSGFFILTSPPAPNVLSTDWTLDETDKAAPAGRVDDLVAKTEVTRQFLINVVKIEYNRLIDDTFADTLTVRDESSIAMHGASSVATIQAVNSYNDASATGASVEKLAANLLARVLPAFSSPMKTITRPIAPTLYNMAPGDTVALSDQLVRNPVSGRRELVSRGCVAIAVSKRFGHEGEELFGEVTLLLVDEDRTYPMAPAADVDVDFSGTVDGITFTDGYASTAAGGPALKLKTFVFSRNPDDDPDVENFRASDEVRIYEIDPPVVASPLIWDRELPPTAFSSRAFSYVRLQSDLVAPAWDGSKQYRITYQRFSEVTDAQKLFAYQCDIDGLIQDEAEANTFAENQTRPATREEPPTIPYRLPAQFRDDDGRPLEPGLLYDHMVNLNAFINHVGAQQMPMMHFQRHGTTDSTLYLVDLFPFFYGLTPTPTAKRQLAVAPILQVSDAAATCTCRVTASRRPPVGAADATPRWHGPFKQVTFTRTGSTAEVISSLQFLPVVPGEVFGLTWISVQLAVTGGPFGTFGRFRGFNKLYLLPVEIP